MSAKPADTLTLPGTPTPADAGDVLEPAAAGVSPELVAADLVDEIDVGTSVAVDVGDRQAVAVIVVSGLVGLARVVHDAMAERDAAGGQPIGELEIMECRDAGHGLDLRITQLLQPGSFLQIVGHVAHRHVLRGKFRRRAARRALRGQKKDRHHQALDGIHRDIVTGGG